MKLKHTFKFILILLVTFFYSCASTKIITSETTDLDIKVDGNRNDWKDKIKYQEDGNYGLGVYNDGRNLKLAFITSNRITINKITKMGFTVWIEPKNGSDKFGIKYPIQETPNKNHLGNINDHRVEDPSNRINEFLLGKQEFMIVNGKDFPLYSYPIASNVGYKLKMHYNTGQLIYELNIPLEESTGAPIILDAAKGEEVEITFVTNELNRDEMPGRSEIGGREGRGNKGSGMRGSGRGGKRGGGNKIGGIHNNKMLDQFEESVIVVL